MADCVPPLIQPLSLQVKFTILGGSGGTSIANTDVNGKAVFGDGKWSEANSPISIKVTKNAKVLFDFVLKPPRRNTVSLTTQQK